jgi:guanylate kinase
MPSNKLFILSGPSGSGQDSIIEGLRSHFEIERVITTTTRAMRPGESQGQPYYFISAEEFQQKIKAGEFVEYAQEYNDHFYGVTKSELERVTNSGKVGIWKIEYKGVIAVKKMFPGIIAILSNAPSLAVLEKRIRERDKGASEEYIQERMDYTKEWLKHKDIYDFEVMNEEGKLDEAIAKTAQIIQNTLDEQKSS